jgi:hypothetical protein
MDKQTNLVNKPFRLFFFAILSTPIFAFSFYFQERSFVQALLPGAYVAFTITYWDYVLYKVRKSNFIRKVIYALLLTFIFIMAVEFSKNEPFSSTYKWGIYSLCTVWNLVYFFRPQISKKIGIKDPLHLIMDKG